MAVAGVSQMFNALSLGGPRKHVVIVSKECLFYPSMNAELDVLASRSDQFELWCTSYESMLVAVVFLNTVDGTVRVRCVPCVYRREELREFINKCWSNGKVVIVCGTVNEDMYIAAHTKSFLVAAGWVPPSQEVQKYDIPASTPTKMRALVEIVANQTGWYYSCTFNSFPVPPPGSIPGPIPVPTKVVSLCLANTYSCVSEDEKAMAEAFQAILKNGANNPVIKKALFCHLMAAIAHDNDFREVQDWAVAPSSSRFPEVNEVMEELKERVRCMMYGRKPKPIFIRHKKTSKSRFDKGHERQDINYCQKHFTSIRVNDHYREKLKGRVVCVFDDYHNHGNTFEALRNLLVACEVKKIIFVSVGKFKRSDERSYVQKDFYINGDVHTVNYTATFNKHLSHDVQFNDNARRSLEDLKTLAGHLQ